MVESGLKGLLKLWQPEIVMILSLFMGILTYYFPSYLYVTRVDGYLSMYNRAIPYEANWSIICAIIAIILGVYENHKIVHGKSDVYLKPLWYFGLLGINLAYGYHIRDLARFLGTLFCELFNPKVVSISIGLGYFFLFFQLVFFVMACFAALLK